MSDTKTSGTSTSEIRRDFRPASQPSRAGGRLLLLLVIATAALGYFSWQQQQTLDVLQGTLQGQGNPATALAAIGQAQQQSDKAQQLLDQQLKLMDQNLQQLQNVQQQLGVSQQQVQASVQQQVQMAVNSINEQSTELNRLSQEVGNLRGKVAVNDSGALRAQTLAEALGMLRLADLRLQVAQDFDAAITLVNNANALLARLNEPGVIALRGQLTTDLSALQAAQQVDVHKVYQRLGEAAAQLGSLNAVSRTAVNDTTVKPVKGDKPAEPGWFNQARDFLGQYFVITQRDAAITPLLSPEQAWYIRQSIELQLQQARMAALNGDAPLYKTALMEAQAAITLNMQGEGKDALLKNLHALETAPLRSGVPSLAAGIGALQQLQTQPAGKAGSPQ